MTMVMLDWTPHGASLWQVFGLPNLGDAGLDTI